MAAVAPMAAEALPAAWRLYLVPTRVATFRNWPFTEGCACTPDRVSPGAAGGRGAAAGSGSCCPPPHPPPFLLFSFSPCPQMAAAGFVHCPSENGPDVAQCFFCLKELEGWEPDDDPL